MEKKDFKKEEPQAPVDDDVEGDMMLKERYNKAVSSLDILKKSHISEMKTLNKPKEEVVMVLQAVCLLHGVKEDWATAQRLMNNPSNFLQGLKQFDKDNISQGTLNKLKKYINEPRFTPVNIARFSHAAQFMCMWVIAIGNYAEVTKDMTSLPAQLIPATPEAEVRNTRKAAVPKATKSVKKPAAR